MDTGLDRLENIKGNVDLFDEGYKWDEEFSKQFDSDIDIIEKDLKDYYSLREDIKKCSCWKEHKALEIIKEMLDNHLLEKLNANSRKIFKDIFDNLPKEKQNLLKEVL